MRIFVFYLPSMKRAFLSRRLNFSIFPLDPGLINFYGAVRTVGMVLLTALICLLLIFQQQWTLQTGALPIVFVMLAGVLYRDAYHIDRLTTMLWGAVWAMGCYLIASTIAHYSVLLADMSFVLVGALCVLLHTQGPRMASVGVSSFVCYYLGLLVHPGIDETIHAALLLCIACLIFCLFSFVLLPNKPVQNLIHIVRTVCKLTSNIVNEIEVIKKKGLTISKKIHLNQSLQSLNEFILAAEAQLSLTEIADSFRIRQQLRELEVAVRLYSEHLQQSEYILEDSHSQAVADALKIVDNFHLVLNKPAELHIHRPSKEQRSAAKTIPLAWMHACKTFIAGSMGFAIGYQISDQRWYWSLFAVLVIYLGAKTTGEVAVRATERIVGTVFGIIFVAVMSYVTAGHLILEIMLMLVSVFLWAYFITTNYVLGVMFATSQSLLAYEKLGVDLYSLLPLRLDENIIGSLAILAVAYLISPLKSNASEIEKSKMILSRLENTLQACQQNKMGNQTADVITAMSRLDMAIKDWKKVSRPRHVKRLFTWWKDEGIHLQSWSSVQHWMHIIVQLSQQGTDRGGLSDQAQNQYNVLTKQVSQLQSVLTQNKSLSHQALISLSASVALLSDRIRAKS